MGQQTWDNFISATVPRPRERALSWYVLDQILPPQPNINSLQSRPFGRLSHVRTASGLTPHQQEHAEFTEPVYEIRAKLQEDGDPPKLNDLLDYLKHWLNADILIQDLACKPFASGNDDFAKVAQSFGPGLSEQRADLT